MSIKVNKRQVVSGELKPYCYHSGVHDYMEVTQWTNGEGFDINIDRDQRPEKFSLTRGEFGLLQVLMNYDVCGCIQGSVWGGVHGDVKGSTQGSVWGGIGGSGWQPEGKDNE